MSESGNSKSFGFLMFVLWANVILAGVNAILKCAL